MAEDAEKKEIAAADEDGTAPAPEAPAAGEDQGADVNADVNKGKTRRQIRRELKREKLRKEKEADKRSFGRKVWDFVVDTVKTVFYALLLAGVFRTVFFQPFWIPSGSMKETLLIGDYVFVNKMAYGYSYASCPSISIPKTNIDVSAETLCGWTRVDSEAGGKRLFGSEPKRGDVVVFRHPVSGREYIKRLIGLPGDRVRLLDGVVYLNGKALPQEETEPFIEPYVQGGLEQEFPQCASYPDREGGDCVKQRFTETLPGPEKRSYPVLNTRNNRSDHTGIYTVPPGHFFFMGDNRDNSSDSRYPQPHGVGYVPFENLVGRADVILFSSAGRRMYHFWTWRQDRFVKAIQ